jgi:anti-sigma factor RsiW
MLSCEDAHRLIARAADADTRADGDPVGRAEDARLRHALDAHLGSCAACRTALSEQRNVATILRSRPVQIPSREFELRLASRLDEASGWFGIVDARVWTFRLAPVAVVLALVAILGSYTSTAPSSTRPIEEWARNSVDSTSSASMLWQQDVNAESLLEMMVTGRTSSASGGTGDVR